MGSMQEAEPAEKQPIVATHGILCRACWHSLKGLPSGSICPECGIPDDAAAWWGRAPARLFQRAATFLLVLCIGAGLLVVLSISLAVVVMRSLSRMFSAVSPTKTDRVLEAVLMPATLCALAACVVGLIGCSRNLAATGLCGRGTARTAAAGMLVALGAWSVTVGQEMTGVTVLPDPWISGAFGLGGSVGLVAWALVHRAAARGVGGAITRGSSWAQLAAAVLLSLNAAVVLLTVYGAVDVRRADWATPIVSLAQSSLFYVTLGVLCIIPLNALFLRAGLRRFAAARAAA